MHSYELTKWDAGGEAACTPAQDAVCGLRNCKPIGGIVAVKAVELKVLAVPRQVRLIGYFLHGVPGRYCLGGAENGGAYPRRDMPP